MVPKSDRQFVVVSAKKGASGSRVCCGATTKEEAEATLEKLKVHDNTKHLGPFEVMHVNLAEKKKLYGD